MLLWKSKRQRRQFLKLDSFFFLKKVFYANLWWNERNSSFLVAQSQSGKQKDESALMTIKIFYGFWGLPAYIRCRIHLNALRFKCWKEKINLWSLYLTQQYSHHALPLMQCKIYKLKSHSGNPSSRYHIKAMRNKNLFRNGKANLM